MNADARQALAQDALAMTLSALAQERVENPGARAAAISEVSSAAGLTALPALDPVEFEALARRLDAHLLPEERDTLVARVCVVSRQGRTVPYVFSILQTLGGALGYSVEELSQRLATAV